MKVFVSYGTASDQIVALRLQTLAAVYGLTTYVPPATTRQTTNPEISAEVQQRLRESEVMLAVMLHNPAASAVSEMSLALATGKLLIPIVGRFVSPEYYNRFEQRFIVDPADPSRTEGAIVRFLAEKQQSEQTKTAVLALATLALGLFLLSDS